MKSGSGRGRLFFTFKGLGGLRKTVSPSYDSAAQPTRKPFCRSLSPSSRSASSTAGGRSSVLSRAPQELLTCSARLLSLPVLSVKFLFSVRSVTHRFVSTGVDKSSEGFRFLSVFSGLSVEQLSAIPGLLRFAPVGSEAANPSSGFLASL